MPTEKRARKKAARDAALEVRLAAYRRRRNARIAGIMVVVAAIGAAIVFSRGGDETTPDAEPTEQVDEVACGGEAPPPAAPQQYDAAPELALADGVDYSAVVHTSCGDITMDLLEDKAPQSVNSFIFLAREGFFDGLTWHRIDQNFVIQTGDPDGQNGQEPDGPGYTLPDEFPDKGKEFTYGVVGMANASPGTTGSQWFIIVHDPEGAAAGDPEPAGLQPLFSIFGLVDESSWPTLQAIATLQTIGGNDPVEAVKPVTPVYIESIDIIEN